MPRTLPIYLLLIAIVFAIYAQVIDHQFLTLDDLSYVKTNEHVNKGLSPEAARWAMTSQVVSNWHPLTMLSHQLDVTLFGVGEGAAGKHLLVNVALHALCGVLLLHLLHTLTGRFWLSAAVAFLWALHPLRVESVAWVAERKDVLCGVFWLLTMLAYVRYARRRRVWWYVVTLVMFVLGYLSKPMIVTLPFVLLLIDVWPLQRLSNTSEEGGVDSCMPTRPRVLILEKLPFFALALTFSIITFLVQRESQAMTWAREIPVYDRVLNAIVSYIIYLKFTLWPSGLAVLYPHRTLVGVGPWPIGIATTCAVALILITTGCAVLWRKHRTAAPLVGWLWFLGTLVPVIGLVQVGFHGHADRYTYLPGVGLVIALVWTIDMLTAPWRRRAIPLSVLTAIIVFALALTSYVQVQHWSDSVALFQRSVTVTDRNWFAHGLLGSAYRDAHDYAVSVEQYQIAVALRDDNADLQNDLAQSLLLAKRFDEAEAPIARAMQLNPGSYKAHNNLGNLLVHRNRPAEALRAYDEALKRNPEAVDVLLNIAQLYFTQAQYPRAIDYYTRALAIEPAPATVHNNLGFAYQMTGQYSRAIEQYEKALAIDAAFGKAHYNLAQVYAAIGQDDKAIVAYRRAIATDATIAHWHFNLAMSLARRERYAEALDAMQTVLTITPNDAEARTHAEQLRRLSGDTR